jgi:hypothetical protein
MTKPFSTIEDLSGLSSSYTNRKENTMVSQNPSNNPAEPLLPASLPSNAKAGTADDTGAVLDPRAIIEVASGNIDPNDPVGRDKPPGVADFDLFV